MKIIRVFTHKNQYTPTDEYCFFDNPPFVIPQHDEVHISCTFTWDKEKACELAFQWEGVTNKPVRLGGVAFGSKTKSFTQGLYLKSNIIFTSRGCNNSCPWCIVPKIEGKLLELPDIAVGNIIQDNNFLQCSKRHKDKVFEMLKTQRNVKFKGGLETDLIDEHFIDNVKNLKIAEFWLACDTDEDLPSLKRACGKLIAAGFNRNKIYCYVLSMGKDMDKDEARAQEVYNAGAMPFMQLYRDYSATKTEYSKEWRAFACMWSRPAATKAHMKKGTHFKDFNT